MNRPTNVQILNDEKGLPAFAVIPYSDYLSLFNNSEEALVPNEVVCMMVKQDLSPIRAWREYLGFTQAEIAAKLGISQAAYAKQENSRHPRETTKRKIAKAFGITFEQIDC